MNTPTPPHERPAGRTYTHLEAIAAARAEKFLRMIQETVDGGGNVVTFQQCDIDDLEDILLNKCDRTNRT